MTGALRPLRRSLRPIVGVGSEAARTIDPIPPQRVVRKARVLPLDARRRSVRYRLHRRAGGRPVGLESRRPKLADKAEEADSCNKSS